MPRGRKKTPPSVALHAEISLPESVFWAVSTGRISHTAFALWSNIRFFTPLDAQSQPMPVMLTNDQLGQLMGLSASQIKLLLGELEQAQLLTRQVRQGSRRTLQLHETSPAFVLEAGAWREHLETLRAQAAQTVAEWDGVAPI